MLIGEASYKSREQSRDFRQLTYTCMENQASRSPESIGFPKTPCKLGIMANHRFPTCWDGVNLDTPNHRDHVAYPETGTFESGGKCPATHPVKIPQILLETVWDTSAFNKKEDWPADGSQPFVWSNGDSTGYGSHADYVFGWKADSLQKAMDAHTYVSAPMLKTQSIAEQNKCVAKDMVRENFDGCKLILGWWSRGMLTCYRAERAAGRKRHFLSWDRVSDFWLWCADAVSRLNGFRLDDVGLYPAGACMFRIGNSIRQWSFRFLNLLCNSPRFSNCLVKRLFYNLDAFLLSATDST